MKALVDNDILLKGSCYGLLPALIDAIPGGAQRYGILGAARFVVPNLIDRARLTKPVSEAHDAFRHFLAQSDVLEPTQAEQKLAAELESSAQTLALNFDVGESQLTAILVSRAVGFLITGDKRAIRALEQLVDIVAELGDITGRVQCLEQCMRLLIEGEDYQTIRNTICAEPAVDKALTICCLCAGGQGSRETLVACLDGYIIELRAEAVRVLATE